MTTVWTAIFQLLLMLGLPAGFITCMVIHNRHDELIRPIIGILLFKKNKIPLNIDIQELFKIGNNHRYVNTESAFWYSYDRLQAYARTGWFRQQDLRRLRDYARVFLPAVIQHEQEQLAKERRAEAARAKAKKASEPPKAKPIEGWRKILGVPAECKDPKVIKQAYRKLVSKDHPDKQGSGKKMPEYNRALDAARNELNFV